jgi:hypothetical protein
MKKSEQKVTKQMNVGGVIVSTLFKGLPFFGVFFVNKVWLQWNFVIYILYQILIVMLIGYLYGLYYH